MYVLLDTNVYFNNWFLKNPSFVKLIRYCNDTDATLLLPEVVVEEVEAKYMEESDKVLKQVDEIQRLCENLGHTGASTVSDLTVSAFSFADVVTDKFSKVKRLPYDSVSHRLLVAKAIGSKRPFTNGEKGYRDALLWHTLVDFLKKTDAEPSIAFVTENSSDFFDGKHESPRFHGDLLVDLHEAGVTNEFLLFRSLRKFVDANKIMRSNGIDRERLESEFAADIESAAEVAAVEYLNSLPLPAMQQFFVTAGFGAKGASLMLGAEWTIVEGTEDPEIGTAELLDKDAVYVPYKFNLRILEVVWTVSASAYLQKKTMFDVVFDSAQGDDEFVHLRLPARCEFEASFILDIARGEILEAAIDSARLRPYW